MKPNNIISRLFDRQPLESLRKAFVVLVLGLGVFVSTVSLAPVQAQQPTPNFGGVWGHSDFSIRKPFETITGDVIDGRNNEYVMAWVAELLTRDIAVERTGLLVTDHSACYPESIPAEF